MTVPIYKDQNKTNKQPLSALSAFAVYPVQFRRTAYQDKPRISFTDLTSMAVMKELGVNDIITGDEHFEHVGMGFQRKP